LSFLKISLFGDELFSLSRKLQFKVQMLDLLLSKLAFNLLFSLRTLNIPLIFVFQQSFFSQREFISFLFKLNFLFFHLIAKSNKLLFLLQIFLYLQFCLFFHFLDQFYLLRKRILFFGRLNNRGQSIIFCLFWLF